MQVLDALGVPRASWYRRPDPARDRQRPGPAPRPLPRELVAAVTTVAETNPLYGHKRIAVMCRRTGTKMNDRQVCRVMKDGASGSCVGSHAEDQGLATAFALQLFHDRAVSAQEAMRHRTGRWRLSQASFERVGRGRLRSSPNPH